MLRATITRDEYAKLRILALNENRPTKDLAGDAIRLYLSTKGKEAK